MKEFLQKIVSVMVDNPETVEIRESIENDVSLYTIVVPGEEVGRIIGKGGKVILAIRTLCRLKAMRENKRVLVKVEAKEA